MLFIVLLLLVLPSCQRSFSPNFDLISVHALKGQIFSDTDDNGVRHRGFSLLSAQLHQFNELDPEIFMADNNSIHGTPAAYFSEGEHIIDLLNSAGCDLMVVDSREFYFGGKRLAELAEKADFPLVSANIRDNVTHDPPSYLSPYYYSREMNVLVIGLSSPSLISRNLPANVSGLELIPPGEAVRDALRRFEATEGVELKHGQSTSLERPFIVVNAVSNKVSRDERPEILDELRGNEFIDLLILGDRDLDRDGLIPARVPDYYFLEQKQDEELERPEFSGWEGRLVLVDDLRSDQGSLLDMIRVRNSSVLDYREFPLSSRFLDPDESLNELLFTIREESQAQLTREISSSSRLLVHRFSGESAVGNLVSDAIRDYTGADVAFINSGSIRGDIHPGPVTLYDAYSLLPFESGIYTLEMTGAQILDVLNFSARCYGDSELEKGFLDAAGLQYRLRWNGYEYSVRGGDVFINSNALSENAHYRVAMTGYLYGGGDGYVQFAGYPIIMEYSENLLGVFIRYLEKQFDVGAVSMGRIGLIPQ